MAGEIENTTNRLEPGDVMVLYTDGVTEAPGRGGTHFGLERLCTLVEQHRQCPAKEILASVAEALDAHCPRREDDVTLVVLRYLGT
jgi:serine phosphatase RsbU (regulator of sigma subunit)